MINVNNIVSVINSRLFNSARRLPVNSDKVSGFPYLRGFLTKSRDGYRVIFSILCESKKIISKRGHESVGCARK